MIKNILIWLGLICLMFSSAGCGQRPEDQDISDDLKPYVETFKQETGIEFHNTDIFLADIPKNTNSYYSIVNGKAFEGLGTNVILINNNYFYDWQEFKRHIVLAHELGHALLGIPHNEKLDSNNCPVSFMHPQVTMYLTQECWDNNKERYYQEFIDKAKHHPVF